MPDPTSFADDWFGKAIAAVVAAPVAALVTWLTSRRLQKANIETMIVNAAGGLVDRLEKECKRVTAECTATRAELSALRAQHRSCENRLDDLERENGELKLKIDELLANPLNAPLPGYTPEEIAKGQVIVRAAQRRQARKKP